MKIVPFKKEHIKKLMDLEPNYRRLFYGTKQHYLKSFPEKQNVWTGLDDNNRVVGCSGVYELWKEVGEGWLLASNLIRKHPLTTIKTMKQNLNMLMKQYKRIQIVVQNKFPEGMKFALMLGFKPEGLMARYGPDGRDYMRMARTR